MSDQKRVIEVQAEDVEAAIAEGLRQLGLSRSEVEIDVLDVGRKGFLGLGGRNAVVRLAPRTATHAPVTGSMPGRAGEPEPAPPVPMPAMPEPDLGPSPAPDPGQADTVGQQPVPETMVAEASPAESPIAGAPAGDKQQATLDAIQEAFDHDLDDEDLAALPDEAEDGATAMEIVSTLLRHMGIDAEIELKMSDPDDLTGRQMLILNIVGADVQSLIGPRGEVLADLQYLARLMAGHKLGRRADFLIDVQDFREQRKDALSSLAQRMARKAVQQGRPVTLEPMSPYDRRIIHMALRDDEQVSTQSTGEGARRRVRIFPKGSTRS
jgi:spoIIIJ-associated protein